MNEYVISLNAPYDKEGIIKELEAENSNLPYFPDRKIKLGIKWNSGRLINVFLNKGEASLLEKNTQIRAVELYSPPDYSNMVLGSRVIHKGVPLGWIHISVGNTNTNLGNISTDPDNNYRYFNPYILKASTYLNNDDRDKNHILYTSPLLPFQLHWHYQSATTASNGLDILTDYPNYVLSGSDFPKYDIVQDLDGTNVDYIHLGERFACNFPDFFDKNGKPRVTVPNNNWQDFNGVLLNNSVHTNYLRDMLPLPVSEYEDSAISHGTACRSVAAGTFFGFAKGANIIPSLDGNSGATLPSSYPGTYDLDEALSFHKNKPINPSTGRKNPTVATRSSGQFAENIGDYLMIDGEKASTITINANDILDKAFRLTVLGRDFTFASSSTTQSAEHYLVNSQSIHHLFKYTGSLQGLETYINKHLAYNSTAWATTTNDHFKTLEELYETTNTSSEYIIHLSASSTSSTFEDLLDTATTVGSAGKNDLYINSTCTGSNYIIRFSGSINGTEGSNLIDLYRARIPYEDLKIDISDVSTIYELAGKLTESINNNVVGVEAINLQDLSNSSVSASQFTLTGVGRINLKKRRSSGKPLLTLKEFYDSSNNYLMRETSSFTLGRTNDFLVSTTQSIVSHEAYFSASYDSNNNTFTFKLWGEQYNPFRLYTGSLDQVMGRDFPRGGYLHTIGSGNHARTIINSLNPYGTPLLDFNKGDMLTVKGGWFKFNHFDHLGIRGYDHSQKFIRRSSNITNRMGDISTPLEMSQYTDPSTNNFFPQNVADFLDIPVPRDYGNGRGADFLPYGEFGNNTRPNWEMAPVSKYGLGRIDRSVSTTAYEVLAEECADEGILIALAQGNQSLLPPESKYHMTENSYKYESEHFPETSSFGNNTYMEIISNTDVTSLNKEDVGWTTNTITPFYNPYNPDTSSLETGSFYYARGRNRTPAIINTQEFRFDIRVGFDHYTFDENKNLLTGKKNTNTLSYLGNTGNFGPGDIIGMFGRMIYNASHLRVPTLTYAPLETDIQLNFAPKSKYFLYNNDINSLYNNYRTYAQNVLDTKAFYGINTSSLSSSLNSQISTNELLYGPTTILNVIKPSSWDNTGTPYQTPKSSSFFKLKKQGGDYMLSTFGGVSSANPQLGGIMCLAKQKYPDLTIKEFKDLLFTKWSKPVVTDYTPEFTYEDGTYNFLFLRRFNLNHNASTHSIEFDNTLSYRSFFIPTSSDNNISITESNKILNINYDLIDAQNHAIIFSGSTEEGYVDPSSYIPSNYNIVKTELISGNYYNNTSGLDIIPTLSRHELSLDFLNDNFNTGFLSPNSLNSENTVITIYESSSSPSEYHWIFMNPWSNFNNASSSAATQGISIITHSFNFSAPGFTTDSQKQDIWRGFIYDKLNELSIVSASATLGTIPTYNASSVVTGDTISITASGSANNLVVKFNNNTNDFVDSFYINELIDSSNTLQLSGSITTQVTSSSPNYSLNLYAALTGALDQLPYVTYSYENNSGYPHYIPTDLKIHPYSNNNDGGNLNISFGLVNGETSSYQNNSLTLDRSGSLKGQLIDEFLTRNGQVVYGGTTSSVYIPIDKPSSLEITGDVNMGNNISIKALGNFSY